MAVQGSKKHCTVFSCRNGRVQEEARKWGAEELHADVLHFVELGNGCSGILNEQDSRERARLVSAARVSVTKHGSTDAVVVCHSDEKDIVAARKKHTKHMQQSVRLVAGQKIFSRVFGVFVSMPENPKWKAVEVCSSKPRS